MKTADSHLQRTFYLLGSLTLIGGLLYWARPILIPLTIAVLVAFVLAPLVGRMERAGVPRFIACTLAVVGAAVVGIGMVHLFTLQVRSLTSEIPSYKTQISEKIDSVRDATAQSWIVEVTDFARDAVNKPDDAEPEPKGPSFLERMEFPWLSILQSVAGAAVEILFDVVLVLVLALLMLMRREDLRNRLVHLLGTDNLVTATRTMDDASRRISRYLLCQLVLNISFGVVVACGLYLIGIPYALVFGALAAVLRYVPFLGGWIAAGFPLLASLVMPSWTPFFLTAIFFLVIEMLQANLVEPHFYGHSIGVSGPGQLIAMLFWGCLWGPVGLIVSAPLTACACVMGRHFPGWRFVATLIGDDEIVEKPTAFYQRLLAGDSVEASDLVEEFTREHAAAEACDAVLIPALLSAASDRRQGDLSDEDQAAITDAVRAIFHDSVAPHQEGEQTPSNSEFADARVVVVELPFHDEVDALIVEMLRDTSMAVPGGWSTITAQEMQADEGDEPSLVLLATAQEKHLVRLRGVCKAVRGRFPDTPILVGCWNAEASIDPITRRLLAAGATAVCTNFGQAVRVLDDVLAAPPEKAGGLAAGRGEAGIGREATPHLRFGARLNGEAPPQF